MEQLFIALFMIPEGRKISERWIKCIIKKHYSEDCLLKKEKEKKISENIKKIKRAITLTPEEIDKYKKKTGKDIPHVESKIAFIN